VRSEVFGDERAIHTLSGRAGVSMTEVRALFSQEFARLALGARIRSYLPALTASNVRARLRSGADAARNTRGSDQPSTCGSTSDTDGT
jgi:hypothetical protein